MPERTVSVSLVADVSNYISGMQKASAGTAAVGKNAQTVGTLTSGFVSKVGGSISSLGNQVGGSFGSALSLVGNGIEEVTAKAGKMSTALMVGGGAAVAAGLALQQLGSGEVKATAQLNTAITNAGDSVSDYNTKVEDAVKAQENFDHSAEDTKGALTILTNATGSTQAGLDNLRITADLAAVKHESLSAAATDVARILGGSGTRTLTQYGIRMDGVGTKTEQAQRALVELAKKLNGQASSSVQNFGSQVDVAKTKVSDWVDQISGPVGSVLTTAGTIVGVTGGAFEIYGAIQEHLVAKEIAAAAAIDAETASLAGQTVAADAASKSLGAKGLGSVVASVATGPVGFLALAAAALYGISALGSLTDAAYNNTIQFKDASEAAGAFQKQVLLGATGTGPKGVLGNANTARGALLQSTTGANEGFGSFFTGIGLGGLNQTYQGASSSITKIDTSLAGLVKSGNAATAATEFNKWKDAAKEAGISTSDLNKEFPQYIKQIKDTGTVVEQTAGSTTVFADATKAQAKALTDATSSAIQSVKPLTDFDSVVTTVQNHLQASATATAAATKKTTDSASDYYDGSSVSLEQFTQQLADNDAAGKTWLDNIQTLAKSQPEIAAQFEAAGYTATNASILQQLINATPEQSAAYIKAQTDAIALAGRAAAAVLLADPYLEEAGHAVSDQTATALGASIAAGVPVATALEALGIKVSATPINVPVTADTDAAAEQINELITATAKARAALPITTAGGSSYVQLKGGKALLPHTGGYVDSNGLGHFATGGGYGLFQGAGSGTSDSIPAMVSNGEYINSASTVSRLGVDFFQKLNRGWSPAPAASFGSSPATPSRSVINHWDIREVTDATGTAMAVLRRQESRAA